LTFEIAWTDGPAGSKNLLTFLTLELSPEIQLSSAVAASEAKLFSLVRTKKNENNRLRLSPFTSSIHVCIARVLNGSEFRSWIRQIRSRHEKRERLRLRRARGNGERRSSGQDRRNDVIGRRAQVGPRGDHSGSAKLVSDLPPMTGARGSERTREFILLLLPSRLDRETETFPYTPTTCRHSPMEQEQSACTSSVPQHE